MRSSISHPKHDFEENRSRNATDIQKKKRKKSTKTIILRSSLDYRLSLLTRSSSREELNRAEIFELKSAPPTVG